jgi:hypothetical protein
VRPSRFLVVLATCLAAATACLALAEVLDAPILFVIGVGFIALALAARFAFLGDAVMAWLVVLLFVIAVGFGVANAV